MEAKQIRHSQETQTKSQNMESCVPSSRFEPNFDAFNDSAFIQDEFKKENERPMFQSGFSQLKESNSAKTDFFSQVTPKHKNQSDYPFPDPVPAPLKKSSRNDSRQSQPRVVTPPRSAERCANIEMQSKSSRSSSSRSSKSGESNSSPHPFDSEMKSSDKTFAKTRSNSLHQSNSVKKLPNNEKRGTSRSRRWERKKLLKQNAILSDNERGKLDGGSILDVKKNRKIHKMQMFDGSYQSFSDTDKFGEI